MVDQTLTKIVQAASQSKLPPDVKSAFQAALEAFRQAEQALMKAAGGEGGEPDEDDEQASGATTMQQGGSGGAAPLSHQNLRGGR